MAVTTGDRTLTHPRLTTLAVCVGIILLAGANVLNNVVAPAAYVLTSVAVAASLVLLARRYGLAWGDLGLSRAHARRGLLWAAALIGGVLVVYLTAVLWPATRGLFEDRRVAGAGLGEVLYMAFVRIPLGTVLLEEVAFRGVIYGWAAQRWNAVRAMVISSVMFGLWHILPARGLETFNSTISEETGAIDVSATTLNWLTIIGAVLASGLAGAFLCELRRRSRSLLAPVGLHLATNGLGVLLAAVVISSF